MNDITPTDVQMSMVLSRSSVSAVDSSSSIKVVTMSVISARVLVSGVEAATVGREGGGVVEGSGEEVGVVRSVIIGGDEVGGGEVVGGSVVGGGEVVRGVGGAVVSGDVVGEGEDSVVR